MTSSTQNIPSFLLIDNALVTAAGVAAVDGDALPGWLIPVYKEEAVAVSPLVIDISGAQEAGELDRMMELANALRPQLHASIIDTELSHAELTRHLRRCILIRTAAGKAFTLRFADGATLPVLATVFSPPQWAAFAGPIARWQVHGRDGLLFALPLADKTVTPSPTPLVLTDQQLDELAEAAAPDMVIAYLRDLRHGDDLPGDTAEQHHWASESRRIWRNAGGAHDVVLRWLTAATLDTHGAIFGLRSLPALLAEPDLGTVRDGLRAAVANYGEKLESKAR